MSYENNHMYFSLTYPNQKYTTDSIEVALLTYNQTMFNIYESVNLKNGTCVSCFTTAMQVSVRE